MEAAVRWVSSFLCFCIPLHASPFVCVCCGHSFSRIGRVDENASACVCLRERKGSGGRRFEAVRAGQAKADIPCIALAVRRSDRASVHDIEFSLLYRSSKTFAYGYARNMLFTGVLCVTSAVGSHMRLRGSGTTPCWHMLSHSSRPFFFANQGLALFLFLFSSGCKQYLFTLSTVGIA